MLKIVLQTCVWCVQNGSSRPVPSIYAQFRQWVLTPMGEALGVKWPLVWASFTQAEKETSRSHRPESYPKWGERKARWPEALKPGEYNNTWKLLFVCTLRTMPHVLIFRGSEQSWCLFPDYWYWKADIPDCWTCVKHCPWPGWMSPMVWHTRANFRWRTSIFSRKQEKRKQTG